MKIVEKASCSARWVAISADAAEAAGVIPDASQADMYEHRLVMQPSDAVISNAPS